MSTQPLINPPPEVEGGVNGQDIELRSRESYAERLSQVLWGFLPLGVLAFGGPQAHIALLHERFVDRKRWLTERQFLELLGLGQATPGPTSTQMVVAIGTMHAGVLGGMLAFFLFQLPGFVILMFAGLAVRHLQTEHGIMPAWYEEATVGVGPAAVSLVFIAAYKLGAKICGNDRLLLFIGLVSSLIATLIPPQAASWVYPSMMAAAGLTTYIYYRARPEAMPDSAAESTDKHSRSTGISTAAGAALITLFFAILAALIYGRAKGLGGPYLALFEAFYRIGGIIFGGGQVILPMLQTEVVDKGWVTQDAYLSGLGLVQALPGPLFNISAYLGAIYKGVTGGFLAYVAIFLPGVLLILALLPFWERFRSATVVRTGFAGINAAAIGLVVAAVLILWQFAVHNLANASVALLTGALVLFFNVPAPVGIIVGGLFGWGLYREDVGGRYCYLAHYAAKHAAECLIKV
eukprot:jgi/Chlat1/8357/Chrsp80S07786